MKKKFISMLLVVTLALTALLPNYIYADDDDERVDAEAIEQAYGYEDYQQLTEEATTTVSGRDDVSITKRVSTTTSFAPGAATALGIIITLPFMIGHTIISLVALEDSFTINNISEYNLPLFTIEKAVFNEIPLLDANYVTESPNSAASAAMKSSVLVWYNAVRAIAIAISLLVLLYIGIRMAIAAVAEEKARYKKMLIDWFFSFLLLFLLHYFIVIVLYFAQGLVTLFGSLEVKVFEESLILQIFTMAKETTGWSYVGILLMYIVLVFYEIKFFVIYMKRLLAIGFLIVISPIITITYSIDRAGDGKAQAFETWMKEFVMFCMTQPVHAALYLVFINTAYEIFKVAPLLAVIFFAGLSRAEKMFRKLFGMSKGVSQGGLADSFKFKHK